MEIVTERKEVPVPAEPPKKQKKPKPLKRKQFEVQRVQTKNQRNNRTRSLTYCLSERFLTQNQNDFSDHTNHLDNRTRSLVKVITQTNLAKNCIRHKAAAEQKDKEVMAVAIVDNT